MPTKNRDHAEEMMAKLFGSTSRPRILNLLLSHPEQALYQREIMYETGLSLQAVQRELENLFSLGILKKRGDKGEGLLPDRHHLAMVQALKRDLRIGWERLTNFLTEFFSQVLCF